MLWLPDFGDASRECAEAVFGRYIAAARASLTPAPVEREPLEDAARRLYAAVGAPEPEIVWVASPRGMLAAHAKFAFGGDESGSWPFSPVLFDRGMYGFETPEDWGAVEEVEAWGRALWLSTEGLPREWGPALDFEGSAQAAAVNRILESTLARRASEAANRRLVRAMERMQKDDPLPSGREAAYEVRRVLSRVYRWDRKETGLLLDWMTSSGIAERSPAIGAILELTYSGIWWLPMSRGVILSERPSGVLLANEPDSDRANVRIRFSDGWGMSVVGGVTVPCWLVDTPAHELNPRRFATIENVEVQRLFVERVGLARLLAAHEAEKLDAWNSYELYRMTLPRDVVMVFLRMTNPSTGAVHVEGVSPRCRTVRGALAWRDRERTYVEPEVIT